MVPWNVFWDFVAQFTILCLILAFIVGGVDEWLKSRKKK